MLDWQISRIIHAVIRCREDELPASIAGKTMESNAIIIAPIADDLGSRQADRAVDLTVELPVTATYPGGMMQVEWSLAWVAGVLKHFAIDLIDNR